MRIAALLLMTACAFVAAAPRAMADAGTSFIPIPISIPIDQAVADLDPLARSLRRIQPGLRQDGEQTSLFAVPLTDDAAAIDGPMEIYQPTNALTDGQRYRYYRVGPGFRARVQRLDYLVRRGRRNVAYNEAPHLDGYFLESAGIAAVYELEPLSPVPNHTQGQTTHPTPPPSAAIPGRLDNQLETRVENRLVPPAR